MPAPVLLWAFKLPYNSLKYNTTARKQSRRFLDYGEGNFLTQPVSETVREGSLPDPLFAKRGGLAGGQCDGWRPS